MAKQRLSTKWIDSELRKPRTKRVDWFDASHAGLCLTIGPASATWFRFMRVAGKLTRVKLGRYPHLSLADARKASDEQDTVVEAGKHPKAEAQRAAATKVQAIQSDEALMVRKLAPEWLNHHLAYTPRGQRRDRPLSRSTTLDYTRHVRDFVADFGDRNAGEMTRRDIRAWLRKLAETKTSDANAAAVVVRQMFRYAADQHDLEANPAADIMNPAQQRSRDRVLDNDEIRALWAACKTVGYPYGHALRLALCTGQRIGEVGAIKRSDLDDGEWWRQASNKAQRRIDVYLAPLAQDIVSDCPDFGPDSFLLSAGGGVRGLRSDIWSAARPRFIDPAYAAQRLKQGFGEGLRPELSRWTPHDLRRTVRTELSGNCGVTPDIAERVLNHSLPGLRKVYDHADYRPQVKDALIAWNAALALIVSGSGDD